MVLDPLLIIKEIDARTTRTDKGAGLGSSHPHRSLLGLFPQAASPLVAMNRRH